ncbi:hypothetical protein [Clostridium sp.]
MKKIKKLSKITLVLIIMSMFIILLSGCQSSAEKSSATTQESAKSDPSVMKTKYEDILKGLVADATIKQDQSDKVLEVLIKNVPAAGTRVKGEKKQQSGEENNVRTNPLSELVTSKVITQAQSDAIIEKTRGDSKRSQN